MAIGDIIVGVDIGTTKVATVIGEVNNFEQIETICNTSYKCSGLKKGKIINEDEISLSLAKTIKNGNVTSYTDKTGKLNKNENYYVRAYCTTKDGTRLYGWYWA